MSAEAIDIRLVKVKERRKFTDDFKRRAVARVKNGEQPSKVAKDLGIVDSVLSNWRAQFKKEVTAAAKRAVKLKKVKAPPRYKKAKAHVGKAHKAGGGSNLGALQEVHVILKHARDAAVLQITGNPQLFDDPVYGLAMMALRRLEGRRT